MDVVRHRSRLAEQTEEVLWMEAHLVPGLDHLLGVGEKRHKLVGVLNLDGRAARLSHLL